MGLADVQILAGITRRPALRRLLAAAGLALAALAGPAAAQEGRPIATGTFDMVSASGVSYRIFTAMPAGETSAAGLSVVYLIDGNTTFPIARDAMAGDPAMRAVLVGIGYPTDDRGEIVALRYFDLTPQTPADLIPLAPGASPPKTGNREAFLSFIETELKPRIEREFPVDRARQALFGHSLGGLFALHVLFTRPEAFEIYVAADPSIWWNGRSILVEQADFIEKRQQKAAGRRLLIETSGKHAMRPGTDAAAADRLKALRGGPGGRAVHEALGAVPGLERAFRAFPEESHGSMVPLAVADALHFALLGQDPPAAGGPATEQDPD